MKAPWRRRPSRLDRQVALGQAERAIPAGTLIYTPAGRKAHVKSALSPGAMCPDLKDWPGPWYGTGYDGERQHAASLPICPRCDAAISKGGAAS